MFKELSIENVIGIHSDFINLPKHFQEEYSSLKLQQCQCIGMTESHKMLDQ